MTQQWIISEAEHTALKKLLVEAKFALDRLHTLEDAEEATEADIYCIKHLRAAIVKAEPILD